MRATKLLQTHHQHIHAIFDAMEKPGANHDRLARKLVAQLLAHMIIEEELFYPAVKKVQRELVHQSFEEHDAELPALLALATLKGDEEGRSARLHVLKLLIALHVHKEEAILFPAVDRALGEAKNDALGHEMEKRFQEVLKKGLKAAIQIRTAEALKRKPLQLVDLGSEEHGAEPEKKHGQHAHEQKQGEQKAPEQQAPEQKTPEQPPEAQGATEPTK